MIGRFSNIGIYRNLIRNTEFYRIFFGGLLAFASYVWEGGTSTVTPIGISLALGSIILNGVPIIKGAAEGLLQRKVNVDELVSLAVIASLIKGEYLTAAVVSFVMVFGALIERVTSESARNAIKSLISITPDMANVMKDGDFRPVQISEVRKGDVLLVRPGERIPVDGVIVRGMTAVDESSVTGEAIPSEKKVDDEVFAGTINQNGVIEIKTLRVGENTTLGRVINLVTEAEAHKPKAIRLIDRYARWFTPLILACAGIAWLLTGDSDRAVAVLIVGCPCALILAAPTAIVATIGRAAKSGILVKGGQYLEEVARSDVVLFDKTGTLTEGEPRVDDIISIDGVDVQEVLTQAACVEQNSSHPLARAVLKAAHYAKVTLSYAEDMITEIGLGVRGRVEGRLVEVGSTYLGGGSSSLPAELRIQFESFKKRGSTPLVVYQDYKPVGVISVADQIRESASDTVEKLKSMDIKKVGMLSGDHEKSVLIVANAVGLTDSWAALDPQEKLQKIRFFQMEGNVVTFVGDGINDAPALATANVGIAMGAAGTDVALETADIALMNDDISKIPFLINLGRKMLRVIRWNIAFGMIFNFVAVLASGWGIITPITGAVVHNVGSVLVVISSASLSLVKE